MKANIHGSGGECKYRLHQRNILTLGGGGGGGGERERERERLQERCSVHGISQLLGAQQIPSTLLCFSQNDY